MYLSTTYDSPVGVLSLCSDGVSLTGLWLDGQRHHGAGIPVAMVADDGARPFAEVRAWLDSYFAGGQPAISDLPLAPIGGEFRQRVWHILTEIPYGQVTTYGVIAEQVAAKMGKERMAPVAVGGAVGHNPISIIIPCHRVVGADGSLTGYAGGINRKIRLLELEGVDMSGLYMPKRGTAL